MNSRTSRPRSPTRQMTLMSAVVERAIMPSSDDLPTPEPAKMPRRWPRPQGTMPSRTRTPRPDALADARALERVRRGAGGRAHAAVGQLLALVDRAAEAVEHAAQQLVADGDADGLAGGGDDVAGADAVQLAERHEQRAALAEADHLGRHRSAAAAGGDLAHLADLGLEAGGLDDQPDEVA